ncbi:hypothetical protein K3K35_001598 [Vibrio parahaemolyticus]|uniref:hypothetical protein n=1 Tax=Vibrio parahaemolyticus TaxID=670 RepID=UPI0004D8B734|nr:hypothetical protein [Vibrio parahaemolyticus]EGQ7874210.1 hypothetical protein [Vibrio parahaemolyticus]EGQ8293391.1 hypothetical protein [Vibrio parahaemolyticus]EGQ8300291.1 hypothetical protein [Vibrio parahaemolyticus]EGR0226346.1 hypothetical protein [Vibrio parahaemolyticus]EGR1362657.1 hypothetical protein [Vibrio parahaemolyticus]
MLEALQDPKIDIQEKFKRFKDKKRALQQKSQIHYVQVSSDVFRVDMDSMKDNDEVRSQIEASLSTELDTTD